MFGFIFSTALTIVVFGILLWLFWIGFTVILVIVGVFAYEETHQVGWLVFTFFGLLFGMAGLSR